MNPVNARTWYFREQAEHSRDLAMRLADQDMRKHLLEMAERYDRLAREATGRTEWSLSLPPSNVRFSTHGRTLMVARSEGLEPPTFGFEARCSIQLS